MEPTSQLSRALTIKYDLSFVIKIIHWKNPLLSSWVNFLPNVSGVGLHFKEFWQNLVIFYFYFKACPLWDLSSWSKYYIKRFIRFCIIVESDKLAPIKVILLWRLGSSDQLPPVTYYIDCHFPGFYLFYWLRARCWLFVWNDRTSVLGFMTWIMTDLSPMGSFFKFWRWWWETT